MAAWVREEEEKASQNRSRKGYAEEVCVCVAIPFILDVRLWTHQPGSHRRKVTHKISPLSFCGACLHFSREKDSAIPFPRRP